MDLNNPEWLTLDFLNHCLQSKAKFAKCTATSFTAESAVPPGNNYGSHILRVKVTTVKKENDQKEIKLSLIIKSPLVTGALKDVFGDSICHSEPIFYNKFLVLGSQKLNYSFSPDSFRSPIDSIVVLEDLKEQGYVMKERSSQLNFEHCRHHVIAAANFQAMSIAVHKQEPNLISSLGKEIMYSNSLSEVQIKVNKNNIRYALECMADQVLKQLDDQRVAKVLKACSTTLWDMIIEAIQPKEGLNSLNQADPWITNMMFKYDKDGKVCDVKLLDFQALRWGSPACHLVFFIWSSANQEVRNRVEDLYRIYLEVLNTRLREMKLQETLTVETLREDVLHLSPLVVWIAAVYLPIVMDSAVTDVDAMYVQWKEDYSPSENVFYKLYTEDYCKNHFLQLVEHMKSAKVFDFLEKQLNFV